MSRPGGSPRRGTVVEFDDHRGLGAVEDEAVGDEGVGDEGVGDEPARRYSFHCTAITGSRSISAGVSVVYSVSPGHLGRYEARGITAATDTAS